MDQPEIMTLKEVAKLLRVSDRTVSEWATRREIPAAKLGNNWRFKSADINSWLKHKFSSQMADTGLETPPVSIRTVLDEQRIFFLDASTKNEVFSTLIDSVSECYLDLDRHVLTEAIHRREALMNTGIGLGVAIPHARLSGLNSLVMAAAKLNQGIDDYGSLDGLPVRLVFLIVAGDHQHAEYLSLLKDLSMRLKDESIRQQLLDAKAPSDFYQHLV